MKLSKIFILILILTLVGLPLRVASAQEQTDSNNPVYIVQTGDTLYEIAQRFGVSADEIIQINQISDPNLVAEGTRLQIPGLENVEGILTTAIVTLGQNINNLAKQYQMPASLLVSLNRITSPLELYAGSNIVLLHKSDSDLTLAPHGMLGLGQSTLDFAVLHNSNPWALVLQNNIDNPGEVIPNDILYHLPDDGEEPVFALSPSVESIELNPLPLVQGTTAEIRILTGESLTISGSLNGQTLNFFPVTDGYVALQGIHAMATPGPALFEVNILTEGNETFAVKQNVLIKAGNFAYSPPIPVDPATIDEVNTKPEDEQVRQIVSPITLEKMWDGPFLEPIDVPTGYLMVPDCRTDSFGNRRAYNNGPYNSFHTGIDLSLCGMPGEIYAPAAGTVVFTGALIVRGNYTVIDHGWGIYTAYGHQSEILVNVGDRVEPGQLIGMIGATGRVDGPHLHWEVWVNRVLVQPMDWINQTYP